MKTHLITRDVPLTERYAKSVCKKDCEILREIPTDADLQDIDMRSLTTCGGCRAAKALKYTYVGRLRETAAQD